MNVWLVGMPGSGKSTVGRIVASRLGARFRDTDLAMERRAGRPAAELFEALGEAFFRRLESEVVEGLAREDGLVVSCGGGAVLDPANRRVIRRTGTVVLLEVPAEVLRTRLGDAEARPVLVGRDPAALWSERARAYRAAAHRTVDATGPAEEVAARVVEALG